MPRLLRSEKNWGWNTTAADNGRLSELHLIISWSLSDHINRSFILEKKKKKVNAGSTRCRNPSLLWLLFWDFSLSYKNFHSLRIDFVAGLKNRRTRSWKVTHHLLLIYCLLIKLILSWTGRSFSFRGLRIIAAPAFRSMRGKRCVNKYDHVTLSTEAISTDNNIL